MAMGKCTAEAELTEAAGTKLRDAALELSKAQ